MTAAAGSRVLLGAASDVLVCVRAVCVSTVLLLGRTLDYHAVLLRWMFGHGSCCDF